jgi:putative copper export protein
VHLIAATIWVGSQVMMFAVVIPSLRLVEDAGTHSRLLRGVTRRFGYLGLAALVFLALTGVDNIDRYAPAPMFDFRYGTILATKLILYVLVILLTAAHALVIGPRLLAAQGSTNEAAARVRSLRRQSILVSSLTLVFSIAILFCAALLRSPYALGSA